MKSSDMARLLGGLYDLHLHNAAVRALNVFDSIVRKLILFSTIMSVKRKPSCVA